MEDVLAVYTRPRDPDRPLVCLDETSKQLIAETRLPIPMRPGRPARCDYEYERNGTANLFMLFAPLEGWRCVEVTDRHTAVDYAHVLKDLANAHFAAAKVIVLIQDNLSTHSKASLYQASGLCWMRPHLCIYSMLYRLPARWRREFTDSPVDRPQTRTPRAPLACAAAAGPRPRSAASPS